MIKPGPALLIGLAVVAGGVLLATQSRAAPSPTSDPELAKKSCDQLASEANGLEQHVIELLASDAASQDAICEAYAAWVIARSLAKDNGCILPDSEVPDMPECEG
jgi:hypothetical protein